MCPLFKKGIDDSHRRLNSPSSRDRVSAILELEGIGTPHAIDLLADTLRDPVPEVRLAAATVLVQRSDPRGFEPLLRLLVDHKINDPSGIASIVLESGTGMELLVEALGNHPEEDIRCGAAWVLCWAINDRVAQKALTRAYEEDPSEEVRRIAADALGLPSSPNPSVIQDYRGFRFRYECPACHRMVASHWKECPDCQEPLYDENLQTPEQ